MIALMWELGTAVGLCLRPYMPTSIAINLLRNYRGHRLVVQVARVTVRPYLLAAAMTWPVIDRGRATRRARAVKGPGLCLCEHLPADFGTGIDHHPRCPAGHSYRESPRISTAGKCCLQCGYGRQVHAC